MPKDYFTPRDYLLPLSGLACSTMCTYGLMSKNDFLENAPLKICIGILAALGGTYAGKLAQEKIDQVQVLSQFPPLVQLSAFIFSAHCGAVSLIGGRQELNDCTLQKQDYQDSISKYLSVHQLVHLSFVTDTDVDKILAHNVSPAPACGVSLKVIDFVALFFCLMFGKAFYDAAVPKEQKKEVLLGD